MPSLSIEDFVLGDQLGEGAFGSVCQCTRRSNNDSYAVKIIEAAHARRHGGLQQVMNEKAVLIHLDSPGHPNIIKLYSTFRDEDHLYIVLELATGGELFSHIKRLGSCHINCARWLCAELVNALEYMHSKQVLHRDLKPENILLDDAGHIKLVDFGSARRLDAAEVTAKFVGTAEYVSPEVLNDEEATAASDLWAVGCILYQMLSGSPPFTAESEYLIFKRIEELDYAFPDDFESTAEALVRSLLLIDQQARLGVCGGIAALKAHDFFSRCTPPIDFESINSLPPPPLVPPPPLPAIDGDTVLNPQLAERSLDSADRLALAERQSSTRWASLLQEGEVIVLAAAVLKRRHLSVKRRQLVLADAGLGCRLLYADPDTGELKGEIPWSGSLEAEGLPNGHFRIHVPRRTYYLEDATGEPANAELWVTTLLRMKSRLCAGDGSNSSRRTSRCSVSRSSFSLSIAR